MKILLLVLITTLGGTALAPAADAFNFSSSATNHIVRLQSSAAPSALALQLISGPLYYQAPTNPLPAVSLAWDLVAGITNYVAYYGISSGLYTNLLPVGATNFVTLTLPGRGPTYFFAVTATDAFGLVSLFSSEVSFAPRLPPGAPGNMRPPVVLNVQFKSTAADPLWSDAGLNWSFVPGQTNAVFRLQITSQ